MFDKMNKILPQINGKRKRIISVKYIIHRLFLKWGIDFEIKIIKSEKTLNDYEKYWNQLCLLIEI